MAATVCMHVGTCVHAYDTRGMVATVCTGVSTREAWRQSHNFQNPTNGTVWMDAKAGGGRR